MPDIASLDPLLDRLNEVVTRRDFTMVRVSSAPWLAELEARLPFAIPREFRHFLNTREFLAFEAGGVEFFPNTSQPPDSFSHALFQDPVISRVTLAAGYLQVGRPDTGSYDPVCLAVNPRRSGTAPLVTLDHEEILMEERIQAAPLFPSFVALLESLVRA